MPNRFTPVPPGTSQEQTSSIINRNFAELDNESTTKLFYNKDGNTGLITGILPNDLGTGTLIKDTSGNTSIAMYVGNDGVPVMKVAKTGKDAVTGADSDMIFNSAQNVFKIVGTFTQAFSLTSGAGTSAATVTITHDLGYKPLTMSSVDITTLTNGTTGIYPLPVFVPGVGGGTTNVFVMLSYLRVMNVTNTVIQYDVGIQGPTQTFAGTITCYVLQETAV